MKKLFFSFYVCFLITVCVNNSFADNNNQKFKLGVQYWKANISSDLNNDADANFWGPTISYTASNGFFVKADFLFGEEEYSAWQSTDVTSAELILGGTISERLELGVGVRYWQNEFKNLYYHYSNQTSDEVGPIFYIGYTHQIAESPISFYLKGSWNFADLGSSKDHEHIQAEGGINFNYKLLGLSAGYRLKNYYNNFSYRYTGFIASANLNF